MLRPSVRSWGTSGCRQDLPVVELLLPPILLCSVSSEDDVDAVGEVVEAGRVGHARQSA
jgi:hypothetical protein